MIHGRRALLALFACATPALAIAAEWDAGIEIDSFTQVSPSQGADPSRRTWIRLTREGGALRVEIRAHDPEPRAIIARHLRRDEESLLSDDHVGLVLDVECRDRNAFYFAVNSNGAQYDSLIYDGGEERPDWDAYWYSEARRDENGWSAELTIPLSAIGVRHGTASKCWRINAERWMGRGHELVRLAGAQPDKSILKLGDAIELPPIPGESSGWGLRIKPSLRASMVSSAENSNDLEPGAELFYQATPDLRLAAAFNIDFGEAEVDDREINLSRFELFRDEKREFFLQDAGRFAFGGLIADSPMPYYSRRIGLDGSGVLHDLDAGLKLSGLAGGFDLGVLAAHVSDGAKAVDDAVASSGSTMGVVRISRPLGASNRVGFIGTAGNATGTQGSRLWGFDYQYRNSQWQDTRTLEADAWVQQSTNLGLGTAAAYGASLNFPNVGLVGNIAARQVQENFFPALGFLAEDDVSSANGEIGWWHRTAAGVNVIPQLDWHYRLKGDGEESSSGLNPEISVENTAGDFLYVEAYFETDRLEAGFETVPEVLIDAGNYRWTSYGVFAGTSPSREWALNFEGSVGGYYDGHLDGEQLSLTWRPTPHWALMVGGGRTALSLPGGDAVVHTGSLRMDFTPAAILSTSLLMQWDSISDELGLSARLRWRWGPAREIFLAFDRLDYTGVRRLQDESNRLLLKAVWNFEH